MKSYTETRYFCRTSLKQSIKRIFKPLLQQGKSDSFILRILEEKICGLGLLGYSFLENCSGYRNMEDYLLASMGYKLDLSQFSKGISKIPYEIIYEDFSEEKGYQSFFILIGQPIKFI